MTNADHQVIYAAVLHFIRVQRGLTIRIVRKRDSILMWVIAVLIYPFNRRFMADYVTTIAGRAYVPDDVSPAALWRVIAHEGVHVDQERRAGAGGFALRYLFPAPLALFALGAFGAFWTPWAWLALVALVALAPLPAPWRVTYEREAYLVSAVCDAIVGYDVQSPYYVDNMVEHFCGWGYYRPAWDRRRLRAMVERDMQVADAIVRGVQHEGYTYARGIARVVRAQLEVSHA